MNEVDFTDENWMTIREAADLYEVSTETIRRYCKSGQVIAQRGPIGPNGEQPWMIHRKDLFEAEKRIPTLRRKRRIVHDKADRVIVDRLLEEVRGLSDRAARAENHAQELEEEKQNQIKLLAVTQAERERWEREAAMAKEKAEKLEKEKMENLQRLVVTEAEKERLKKEEEKAKKKAGELEGKVKLEEEKANANLKLASQHKQEAEKANEKLKAWQDAAWWKRLLRKVA